MLSITFDDRGGAGLMTLTFLLTSAGPVPTSAALKFYIFSTEIAIPLRLMLIPVFHPGCSSSCFSLFGGFVSLLQFLCLFQCELYFGHSGVLVMIICRVSWSLLVRKTLSMLFFLVGSSIYCSKHCSCANCRKSFA